MIVLEQPPNTGSICSIVLKGSTEQLLDDLERAVDDGVNTFKVHSAWCCESALAIFAPVGHAFGMLCDVL